MKSPLLVIAVALLLLSCNAQQKTGKGTETVFKSVNVIPMDTETVLADQDVVISDGKITGMGNTRSVDYSKDAVIINAKGKYLIPGLAEMHAHVPPIDDIEPMKEVLLLFAVNGVTTIRGMLGHPRHIELRNKVNSGEILGPKFYTSGPSFNGQTVPTPQAAEALVREQKSAGYDFLKIHPGIKKEPFAALVKTAKEVGIPIAGHVPYEVGVWRAIDADYATIDHMDGFVESLVPGIENVKEQDAGLFGMFIAARADTNALPKLLAGLKQHNVWVVPTQALAERWFSPYHSPEALAAEPEMVYMDAKTTSDWINAKKSLMANSKYDSLAIVHYITLRKKLIAACYKNNAGILSGSDAPQVFDVPGFSLHHELKYMVDAGLTPYEALRTSTVNVASFYKKSDEGQVKKNMVANLVLLNGNPLTDISETANVEGVVLRGKWLSKDFITQTLAGLKKK
ncbi:amidohydrolase family protein [Foetidibacter luteolus]|uniref:amidohydrolase family protein n=1 Tax=Foetidibacter luteolus TaxID=2608880 RepID=UPI00129B4C22|nr:amidohydrolase family protein [Foetidibacter luteolus]